MTVTRLRRTRTVGIIPYNMKNSIKQLGETEYAIITKALSLLAKAYMDKGNVSKRNQVVYLADMIAESDDIILLNNEHL